MVLTRRQFLKWAGASGIGAVVFNGCRVPEHEIQVQSPVQLPEDLVTGRDNYYATVAQVGAASEGLLVRVMEGRAKKVEGNPDYPVNAGKHHIRSEGLLQAAYHPDRIKAPMARIAKGGPFREITWDEALSRLSAILNEADAGSVLMATNPLRGQIADVVKGFADQYGSRLLGFEPVEHSVLREAIRQVYGQDALPTFDIARADMIVSFGADFLGTWIDPTHFMRGYGEFRQGEAREHRGHLVHIDSRFSVTAAAADEWRFVTPGTEGLLAMAMIETIIREGLGDRRAAAALTANRGAAALRQFRPDAVAAEIGMSAEDIEHLAHQFAEGHSLAIGGGSAAAHTNGLFNLIAIYSLNHLVGAVNAPGGVIFNPAGMQSQVLPGTIREWKNALDDMRSGDIKVLLVREADIDHGLSVDLDVDGALGSVETIVSFSSFLDDTTARADLILPGHTALEEWGTDTPDVGPGYATVAFQQPVINRFRNTLAFGDVLLQIASDVGVSFPWGTMRDAVRETVRTLHGRGSGSIKDELPATAITFEEFWKRGLELGGWWDTSQVEDSEPAINALPGAPVRADIAGDPDRYELFLVPFEGHGVGTGRFANLPWIQATPDPITTVTWATWVELNPVTAERMKLQQDDVVSVESASGKIIKAPVYVNPATPPNVAAIPMGQGHKHYTSYAADRGANVLDIVVQNETETGSLAWAGTRVRLTKSNKRVRLPKLEGLVEPRQLPGEHVVEVFRAGQESGGAH